MLWDVLNTMNSHYCNNTGRRTALSKEAKKLKHSELLNTEHTTEQGGNTKLVVRGVRINVHKKSSIWYCQQNMILVQMPFSNAASEISAF